MNDQINALNNLKLSSELIPQAQLQILSIFNKRNDFASANEFIKAQNMSSNLYDENINLETKYIIYIIAPFIYIWNNILF